MLQRGCIVVSAKYAQTLLDVGCELLVRKEERVSTAESKFTGTDCGASRTLRLNLRRDAKQPKPNYKHRFPYNGTDYRSTWEVEAAQLFDELGIKYVYEQYHVETRTYPDFYIVDLDLYLEIHPPNFGSKRLPKNSILIESKSAIKPAVLQISATLKTAA